jgi:glutamyl-tRNA synthetase
MESRPNQFSIESIKYLMGYKLRDFMFPFFVAIAGSPSSTPVMESMGILGADLTFARLRQAVEVLGGLSKNEQSEWQLQWQALKELTALRNLLKFASSDAVPSSSG